MDLENVIYIIAKNLVNVAMRTDAWFYNIFMYLNNKNILEYAQIVVTRPNSRILNIDGHSSVYFGVGVVICLKPWTHDH